MNRNINNFLLLFFILFFSPSLFAKTHVVNLVIEYKTVNIANKKVKAIAVNNQIPAPTLHFKESDHVIINVYNHLDKETAIHWHGLIVPWQMDGVLGVTQKGIQPGSVFHYQFTLHQSGTYWYHAHAGLQEQQGLYGAFIIDPVKKPSYQYSKEYVAVLSDWSNTDPDQIEANLKKDGDYYSPRFPLQPSLAKFIHDYRHASKNERQQLIDDYKMMQQMRMSIYDFSDVAYDTFLLNGKPPSAPWTALVKMGEVIRLRFIGASASTIFRVKIPNSTMQLVQVDGNDVDPVTVDNFSIAPGETYDVLVKITQNDPSIIYAESKDTVGAAVGAFITSPHQLLNDRRVMPFAQPLPVTREMMSMMRGKTLPSSNPMGHSFSHHIVSMNRMPMNHTMSMPTEPSKIGDHMSLSDASFKTSIGTKYQSLKAAVKTNDPNRPIENVITMELFGYMERYIWFINGVPEYKAKPIVLNPDKRYRIIFTNMSMMHHPMHIHGHWFILREGKGAYDPLLHTIDVPPGATMTADIDTDMSGQWLFHCHFLYHMMSGMSRVIQYSTLINITHDDGTSQHIVKQTSYYNRPIIRIDEVHSLDHALVYHPMPHSSSLWLATFLEVSADPFHHAERLTYKGLYGYDYNKLELFANDVEVYQGKVEEADIDIFYWHLISQFWAIKGGINYDYRPSVTPYWQPGMGIEGLTPYFIDTGVRGYYYHGSAKIDVELSRDTQITNNFFIRAGVRSICATKSVPQAEIGSGLNQMRYILRPYYRLMPGLNVYAEYEQEQDYGSFKHFQRSEGEPTMQNTVTFGVAVLF